MLKLSAQHPEYAVLVSKYYVEIGKQVVKLQQEVTQDILNENKDYLMDAMDREMLIEKVFTRVRNINGNILYIILRLENAKKIPYLYQVPVLRNYINIDKAIVGDTSDNIPGVKGVGEKTAISLLEKFGTLDAIYQNLDQVESRWRTKLETNKDAAYMSRDLARIEVNLKIKLDLEHAAVRVNQGERTVHLVRRA